VDPHSPESDTTESKGNPSLSSFERGEEKWCKEHMPRKGKEPISEEGQNLLDDPDRWCDRASLLKECYEPRKRERTHEDGSFMHHQKGSITTTYTTDWFLREGLQ